MESDFKTKMHDFWLKFRGFLNKISFFGKDHTKDYNVDDVSMTKAVCIFAYFGLLFFLPLVVYKDSKYGKYHANQGLLLLILSVILSILRFFMILPASVPFFGAVMMVLSDIISFILGSFILGCFVFGIVNVARNKAVDLPIVGKIRIIK